MLLVIDNCEHLIDDVRIVVNAILRSCPDICIVATSRESLNVAGERVFRLPSLAVPPAGEVVTTASAQQYGAVTLFADRAIASDGRFTLSDENVQTVAEICRRLDGIPLAIELAAARIKVLSPQQLLSRLNERFRVLTGGDRSALPRHQTMRALIDWSYDLLSDPERALFRGLSIFAAGFTLEGAAAVCSGEDCDEIAVLDLLSSLVDKSLLQTDPGAEERYRLLESTRQYAREKLEEIGEFEDAARRHLAYLAQLFKKAGMEYETTLSGGAVMPLAVELEDARTPLIGVKSTALMMPPTSFSPRGYGTSSGCTAKGSSGRVVRCRSLVKVTSPGVLGSGNSCFFGDMDRPLRHGKGRSRSCYGRRANGRKSLRSLPTAYCCLPRSWRATDRSTKRGPRSMPRRRWAPHGGKERRPPRARPNRAAAAVIYKRRRATTPRCATSTSCLATMSEPCPRH